MNAVLQHPGYAFLACVMVASLVLTPHSIAESPEKKLRLIEFDGKMLVLNNQKIRHPFWLYEIIRAIGKPDRSVTKLNIIHTWDHHGIVAIQESPGTPITAFQIIYSSDSRSFAPAKPFAGEVVINGQRLAASSNASDLSQAGFTQSEVLTYYYKAVLEGVSLVAKYENGFHNIEIGK